MTYSVKYGILQNACTTRPKVGADLVKNARVHIVWLMNNRTSWVQFIEYTTIGLRFSGYGSAEVVINLTEELRHAQKPIQCMKFTKAIARHAKIRDQNPSLGLICPGELHQRRPNAPKFEDRSQEETKWHERCAREAALRLARSILKVKEKHKAAFFSPSEKKGACLLQILNLRNENLLSTPERRCI